MYPTDDHIYNGIHVKEQIEALCNQFEIEYDLVFINGRKSKLNYLKSIFSINRILKQGKFDIVHIHFGLSGFFLLFNPALRIPAILTLHGSDTNANKSFGLFLFISRLVVKRVSKAIVLNEKMIKLFNKNSNKLVKIPCGINVKLFDVKRQNTNKNICIGFPGDIKRPGKNYNLFCDIIELVRKEGYQVEIVITNLSKLDCIIMTSLYEGSPQIIKEAMIASVPIVSSNVGDVKYVLKGVNNCYVVDSFEPEHFFKEVSKILKLNYNQRITNGKERIYELGFNQDSIVDDIFKIYKEISLNEKEN